MRANYPPENKTVASNEMFLALGIVVTVVSILVAFSIYASKETKVVSTETARHGIIGGFIVDPEPDTICKIESLNADGTVEASCYSERTIDPAAGTYVPEDHQNHLEVSKKFQKSQCL